jgi:Rrf2 family transcriptional regulator, cysteine metabolism repressor
VPAPPSLPLDYHPLVKLSKRAEYGLRAIVALARLESNTYVQTRDLAAQEKLPAKFLEAILLILRRGGLLESKVGAGGGYRLSRKPRDIAVGDLVRRLEGRLSQTDTTPHAEQSPGGVAVRLLNDKLTHATDHALDAMSLEDLLEHVVRAAQGNSMYYI